MVETNQLLSKLLGHGTFCSKVINRIHRHTDKHTHSGPIALPGHYSGQQRVPVDSAPCARQSAEGWWRCRLVAVACSVRRGCSSRFIHSTCRSSLARCPAQPHHDTSSRPPRSTAGLSPSLKRGMYNRRICLYRQALALDVMDVKTVF